MLIFSILIFLLLNQFLIFHDTFSKPYKSSKGSKDWLSYSVSHVLPTSSILHTGSS
jgi:hypothetical protein